MNCRGSAQYTRIYFLQRSSQYDEVMLPKKAPFVCTYVPEAQGRKVHFSEAKFKCPKYLFHF